MQRSSSLSSALGQRGLLDPVKPAYDRRSVLYASSPGNRAYCYAELAVSSLAVAETITSTPYAYPRRDGQAELACVVPRWYAHQKTGHPSQY